MKKVFITGGTTGIGLELAKIYHKENFLVGICGRDLSKLPNKFLEDYPRIKAYESDVCDKDQLANDINDFAQGQLDIVIANAGISEITDGKRSSLENARKIVNINISGFLNTLEPALEIMHKSSKGHIVATSSVAGEIGLPKVGAYCGSKAFVTKYLESLSIDLYHTSIDVSTITPGFVDTNIMRGTKNPMPFILSSEKAANIIFDSIQRKKRIIAFPLPIRIGIWLAKKLPQGIYFWMMSKKKHSII